MATSDELQNAYQYARMRSLQGGSNADQAHISGLLAVQARVQADTEAQLTRFAKAAMYGAEVVDAIPYFNGTKQVAAYQQFDQFWMTQLSKEDMTRLRQAVGMPEPEQAGEAA